MPTDELRRGDRDGELYVECTSLGKMRFTSPDPPGDLDLNDAEDASAYPRTESELGDFDGWTTVKAPFVPYLEFDDCRGGLLIIYKSGFTMARSVTSIGSNKTACLVDGNFMCDCAARITDLSSLDPENFNNQQWKRQGRRCLQSTKPITKESRSCH